MPTTTSRRRRITSAAFDYTVAILLALAIWPVSLGGWATFAIVSGKSMAPTFLQGDLALAYDVAPDIGDVVIYRAPVDGLTVIHRIVDETPDGWVLLGDNNPQIDPWTPTDEDIVGKVVLRIPGGGHLVGWAGTPLGLGTLAALLLATWVWPSRTKREDDEVVVVDGRVRVELDEDDLATVRR